MQAVVAQCMNVSECPDSILPLSPAHTAKYVAAFTSISELEPVIASRALAFQLTAILLVSIVWLSTQHQARRASKSLSISSESKVPPKVPYLFPVLGHVVSYFLNPFGLASYIRYVVQPRPFFQYIPEPVLTNMQPTLWSLFSGSSHLSLERYLPRKRGRVSQRRLEEYQRPDHYQWHQHFSVAHVRHTQGGHEGL